MYFLSALYTLQSVPIVKVILVILFKKKKQEKNDPYFGMGKNTKVMPQKSLLSIFSLGKGGNPSIPNFIKTKLSALSALPSSMQNIFNSDTVWMTHTKIHTKIDQKIHFFLQILHLSSNRRVHNLALYFQCTTPARELTHRTKFEYPERHKFQRHRVSSLPSARETPEPIQKDKNFGDTMFLHYLEPEKCQKSYPETTQISARP